MLENAETYAEQFSRIFDLDGENPAEIKFNGHWLDNITLAQFVEIMDKFTVQQLLERSMFQQRIKSNQEALYLNEMIYPILQGYDSVAMEVDAELGGTDQLFNMMRGRDLVKAYLGKTKHVLTTQLLEGLDGRKMSKTYGNTVDLTEDPVPMFFKLTLVQDSKLPRFMQVLTDRTDDEISAIEERAKTEHNMIDARQQFAHDMVTMLHSAEAADEAQREFEKVITDGEIPSDIKEIYVTIDAYRGDLGIDIATLLNQSSLVQSKSDARRLIDQGGIRINGEVFRDPRGTATEDQLQGAVIKIGKRGYVSVHVPELLPPIEIYHPQNHVS